MHELSIALSLIDVASEESLRRGGARVTALHLKIGPLSGVVMSALQGAFELAREGTSLSEARLVIQNVPVTIHCRSCNGPRPVESIQSMRCIGCGAPSPEILTGRELELTALEILDAPEDPPRRSPDEDPQTERCARARPAPALP